MGADELVRATATNLHGEFAEVVTTEALLEALDAVRPGEATASPRDE